MVMGAREVHFVTAGADAEDDWARKGVSGVGGRKLRACDEVCLVKIQVSIHPSDLFSPPNFRLLSPMKGNFPKPRNPKNTPCADRWT